VWNYITGNHRSSVDWKSATPLTPALREKFPDLLGSEPPSDNIPPVPAVPNALQSDNRTVGSNDQRHLRTDSALRGTLSNYRGQNLRHDLPAKHHHEQSMFIIPRKPLSSQIEDKQLEPHQAVGTTHQAFVRSHSPLSFSNNLEDLHPAWSSSNIPFQSPSHDPNNIHYVRDGQGRLFPAPSISHRQAVTQSSLRDQMLRERSNLSRNGSTTDTINGITEITGRSDYSRFPSYSPTAESHALSQSSRCSSTARPESSINRRAQLSPQSSDTRAYATHHRTITELQASACSPADTSLSLSELRELEDEHTPLPLLATPYAQHHATNRSQSTTSIATSTATSTATFENPDYRSPPLTLGQARLAGFASIVGLKHDRGKSKTSRPRPWIAKLVKYGKKIKNNTRVLWDAQCPERRILRCEVDVLWTGPLRDCECKICLRSLGPPYPAYNWMAYARPYHEVPKGQRRKTSMLDYHKLNWGREAEICCPDAPRRGLGARRAGRCVPVTYVTTPVDLDE
jgi:hypothetical protein